MSETVYLGSGKTVTGQYGEFFNVTLNLDKIKQNPDVVEDYKGTKFVRLRISKKEQPDKYGKNVNVVWNDPSKIQKKTETQTSSNDTGLPF
jgi:hypothetical protein